MDATMPAYIAAHAAFGGKDLWQAGKGGTGTFFLFLLFLFCSGVSVYDLVFLSTSLA
jgi:hypothetical protein